MTPVGVGGPLSSDSLINFSGRALLKCSISNALRKCRRPR